MPLQIRRGTTVQRQALSGALAPLPGELIYDTVEQKIYVGDGTTTGGNALTGLSTEDAQDAAAGLFTTGSHSGITFTYNDAAGRIDATVTVAATGPFDGDLTGSVFSDTSTLLVDGVSGRLVGPLATSGLADDLDTGSFTINSSTGNVNIAPTGRTIFGSDTSLVNGDVYITRNSYSSTFGDGFTFSQHHSTQDVTNFVFYRSRGTGASPATVLNGDDLADISFLGWDGTNIVPGAAISVTVEGAPTTGNIPSKISFAVNNGSTTSVRAELGNTGIWKVNSITAITTNSDIAISGNGTGNVNIESVKISGSTISTTDSSSITVSQASTFSSNLTVDGTLTVGDSVVQNNPNRDYVSTTLQTQGVARVVEGVQNGTYTQVTSSTAETYTAISYNSTTYRGCRALIKASYGATNVYIGEVLLANTTTTVTIVNAQTTAATIGTSPISSVTADYDSETSSIRLRPVTSAVLSAGANYNWIVSYQLFT
jgi:hypothetical protein